MNKLLLMIFLITFQMGCDKDDKHGPDDEHGHNEKKEEHDKEKDDHKDHDKDKHDEHGDEGHDDHGEGKEDHGDEEKGEHEEEEGTVHLSSQAFLRSGIKVAKVTKGSLKGTLKIPAEVQSDPDYVAHISPLVEGKIVSVDVRLGNRVKVGQKLATLRSVTLGKIRAELSKATALRDVAKQTLNRQERLRSEGINSKRSLIEAQYAFQQAKAERRAALSQLRVFGARGGSGADMDLTSPIEGSIIKRHATRGENASPERSLFVVADLSKVWIIGRVYEQQIAQIRKGMKASVTLNAYPAQTWEGKIDYVGAAIEEDTRTLPIRVELANPDGLLRPGLFGSLRLSSNDKKEGILVPLSSIQTMENKSVVFVQGDKEGEFVSQPVTVGRQGKTHVEILSGLKPDSKIVIKGAFILKSELMRSELGHGHAH